MTDLTPPRSWRETLRDLLDRRVVTLLLFGFSAGLPLLLIFSSLSLWLREAGVERSAVTLFSWAALGYSFKFVWAPLVDRLPLPWLTRRLGRRRGWLLVAQMGIIAAILAMSTQDPGIDVTNLRLMAVAAVALGFSSATQDIVIDAYRIESAPPRLQALLSAAYIAGYRMGMLVSGAGALALAAGLGSELGAYHYQAWQWTYRVMALMMLVGVAANLLAREPEVGERAPSPYRNRDYLGFVLVFLGAAAAFVSLFSQAGEVAEQLKQTLGGGPLAGFLIEALRLGTALAAALAAGWLLLTARVVAPDLVRDTYLAPFLDFFRRYQPSTAWLLLGLIGVYRIADILLGVIANVFYQDLGFTKPEIATIVNSFGLGMTILGGFLGGLLSARFGVTRLLWWGALLAALTNLLFMLLAQLGHHPAMLYLVISADNLSAGLASAAFVAFLSSLTSVSFTAVQYAIFSSLMTLLPKLLGGYSGSMVDALGYPHFFLLTALAGLPVLWLVARAGRLMEEGRVDGR